MPYIGNQPAPTNVSSANITDNSIVNADVNASAAIDVSKLSGAAPLASPTFTGTATAPTVNASTALQIGGVAITATAAELNILDGVTSTAAELNILDGVTSTAAELNILDGVTSTAAELNKLDGYTGAVADLNRTDVSTEGLSEASKVVTADANGDITVSEEFKAKSYNETHVALSPAATVDINFELGNSFSLTTNQNTTFTFSNPPASGTAYGFILELTAGGTHSVTYPTAVDFAGNTAPDAPASGEKDILVFHTRDGGTNYHGSLAIDAAS